MILKYALFFKEEKKGYKDVFFTKPGIYTINNLSYANFSVLVDISAFKKVNNS